MTESFVQQGFTDFECEVALDEAINGRHRIIPVIVDDIKILKPKMSRVLQFILESFTYIELPCNQDGHVNESFWRRLQDSLPRK